MDLSVSLIFVGLVMFCVGQSRRGLSHVWTTPIARFNPLISPGSTKSTYPSTKGPEMDSVNPDYFGNPHAKAPMPTHATRYAFGNDGTAQIDSESMRTRVVSDDLLGDRVDPFSSERELVPTPGSDPSPDQWQQFPSARGYPTMGLAY